MDVRRGPEVRPTMRWIGLLGGLCAIGGPLFAVMPPLPRPSPPFTITQPSGKKTPLASYRGKVVVLAWVHTNCQYCQDADAQAQ